LAQRWDLTVEELVRNVHTHPTLSEGLQEAFHGLAGKMINFWITRGRPPQPAPTRRTTADLIVQTQGILS
jgi:hypothetical protein